MATKVIPSAQPPETAPVATPVLPSNTQPDVTDDATPPSAKRIKLTSIPSSTHRHATSAAPSVFCVNVTAHTLPSYRRLISTALPIRYPDKFYTLSTSDPSETGIIALCAIERSAPRLRSSRSGSEARNGSGKAYNTDRDEEEELHVVGGIQARLEALPPPPSDPPTPPSPPDTKPQHGLALYIQTLATLPSHREMGIASSLLNTLVPAALSLDTSGLSLSTAPPPTSSQASNTQKSNPPPSRPPCPTLPAASPHLSHLPSMTPSTSIVTPTDAEQEDRGRSIRVVYAHVWEKNPDALEWYRKRGFQVGNGGKIIEKYYWKLRPGGAWIVERRVGVGDWLAVKEGAEGRDGVGQERGTGDAESSRS